MEDISNGFVSNFLVFFSAQFKLKSPRNIHYFYYLIL